MASGAVIAMAGLLSGPVPQSLALAAAGIIAPAFEPVAKLAVGLVRGSCTSFGGRALPLAVVTCHWPSLGALALFAPAGAGHGEPRGAGCQRRSQMVTHPTATASR